MLKRMGIGATIFACAMASAVAPGLASAPVPHVCSGTKKSPGVLSGNYNSPVEIKGYCTVNKGPAQVAGRLHLLRGSVLLAAYGEHNSHLTVSGSAYMRSGSTLVLGCNPTSFACLDDPHPKHPTLTSQGSVAGDVIANAPLAVVIHSTTIAGDLQQTGGGGDFSCKVPKSGPFAALKSPVFSTYEDDTVLGNVSVSKINTCWLGLGRLQVTGNVSILGNKLGDSDAIEVLSNTIHMNLVCRHNSPHLWDSVETTGHLFPRQLERNTVDGTRSGQCVKAGPLTKGGPPAGGPF